MLVTLFNRLQVPDISTHINTLGCPKCRPGFKSALQAMLMTVSDNLCSNCIRRRDRNPLRVLDCKVPACRETLKDAPSILDHLCSECQADFTEVRNSLDKLKVPYVIDKRLVRGLDYYARTTFEIQTGSLGAQSAVAGGGRYDGLVKELGGPQIPATGFAIGFDRLAEISGLQTSDYVRKPDIYLAALGEKSQSLAFEWICQLGLAGIGAEMDFSDKSLKSQMKRADRLEASYVLILGDKELDDQTAILRNMATTEQTSVSLNNILENLKNQLTTNN